MSFWAKKKGDEVIELISLLEEHYTKEKADLLLKVDSNVPKFKVLVPQPEKNKYPVGTSTLGSYVNSWFNTKHYYSGDKEIASSVALAARREEIIKVIDTYIADCAIVFEQNKPIVEHNKVVVDKITALMKEVGIPSSYSESYYKTTCSSRKTTDTKSAGYLQDISRNIKTSQPSVPTKDSMISDMQRNYDELHRKILLEEGKAERERKAQEELHSIALLRAKYTPDNAMSDGYDLIDAIIKKDKYLRLAYYLEKNRGDWNDGYGYAETGLDGFTVEDGNSLDQDIYDCINECIESGNDGDIDGRIFRDCEYNYGVIYGYVTDASLLSDLEKVKGWSMLNKMDGLNKNEHN